MKDIRTFEGIISELASDRLKHQPHLSILSRIAGLRRGKITNFVVGSYHLILFQETHTSMRSQKIATEQCRVQQGADQLILVRTNTFELHSVKTARVIPGTSNQDSFGLKYFMVRSRFIGTPKNGKSTHAAHLSNTTAKGWGIANMLLGQFKETAELNDADIIGSDFNMSACREPRTSTLSSCEQAKGDDTCDPLSPSRLTWFQCGARWRTLETPVASQ